MSFLLTIKTLDKFQRDRFILLSTGLLFAAAAFLFPFESLFEYFWWNANLNQAEHWRRITLLNIAPWLVMLVSLILIIAASFFTRLVQIFVRVVRAIEAIEEKKWLWTMVFLAVVVRLVWIICFPSQPVIDALAYDSLGWKLASGKGYYRFLDSQGQPIPSAYWPIGYPLFLAFLYYLGGHQIIIAKVANLVFIVMTIILAYFLARHLFNPVVAKLTSCLLTLWPNFIAYANTVYTEPLFTFLLILVIVMLVLPREKLTKPQQVGIGLALGCAALVKPILLLFPSVIFLILAAKYSSKTKALVLTASIALVMGITIMPWTIRNYKAFNKVIVVSANLGDILWFGNNPESTGIQPKTLDQYSDNICLTKLRQKEELEANRVCKDLAKEYILANPINFFAMGLKKTLFLYSKDHSGINLTFRGVEFEGKHKINLIANIVNQGYYMFVMLAFTIYLIPVLRTTRQLFNVQNCGLLIMLYFSAIYFVIIGNDRFHVPFVPFIAMYASVSLEILLNRYRTA